MSLTGFYADADIPFMMGDLGVSVVCSGVTTLGIVDNVGKDSLVSQSVSGVSGTEITVTVQTSAWPDVPNRTPIVVDGKAMFIRDQNREGDGALTKVLCSDKKS
jgi:hypothetical protein